MSDHATHTLTEVSGDLLNYFRRRVGSDRAPDLLAETMTTAWRRVAMLPEDRESARRWLFGIAHHVLLNDARSQRRQARLADKLRSLLTANTVAAADQGVEVRDALARLDPALAELVRLVHWEGFTLSEAAEVLGRPSSTVRNEYGRAKVQLRAILGESKPSEVAVGQAWR